jgi:2'-5' RNA ligase
MRTFISIDLPKEIISEIVNIQKSLPEFLGKITESENIHLTLKFLGEIDDDKLEEVKKCLSNFKIKYLDVELTNLGVFSPNFIKIIWIKINGTEDLQKQIDSSLVNLFKKEKQFMGHLTIARVKNVKDNQKFLSNLEKIKLPSLRFKINSFKLRKSTLTPKGPIYETLEEYFLK